MTLQEKFRQRTRQQQGLLATNYYNFETLSGVLQAAQEAQQPLILQLTQSSIDYLSLPVAVSPGPLGLGELRSGRLATSRPRRFLRARGSLSRRRV